MCKALHWFAGHGGLTRNPCRFWGAGLVLILVGAVPMSSYNKKLWVGTQESLRKLQQSLAHFLSRNRVSNPHGCAAHTSSVSEASPPYARSPRSLLYHIPSSTSMASHRLVQHLHHLAVGASHQEAPREALAPPSARPERPARSPSSRGSSLSSCGLASCSTKLVPLCAVLGSSWWREALRPTSVSEHGSYAGQEARREHAHFNAEEAHEGERFTR